MAFGRLPLVGTFTGVVLLNLSKTISVNVLWVTFVRVNDDTKSTGEKNKKRILNNELVW